MTTRRLLLALLCAASSLLARQPQAEKPKFSFGLTTDIQYADKDDAIGRAYRASVSKLGECVEWWNRMPLAFVIQLGDFVDSGPMSNFDAIAAVMGRIQAPVRNVLGNHDFFADRKIIIDRLHMPAAYYKFSERGWQFIVLDGMNVSAEGSWPESDPHAVLGRQFLANLTAAHAINAKPWDGALGSEQRDWLTRVLAEAHARNEPSVVFCHAPALAASCRPMHLLWDHAEVVRILEASPSVVAFLNGHDHKGGYAESDGIHYVTFPALVEHSPEEACKVLDVFPNRLVIRSLSGASQTLGIQR